MSSSIVDVDLDISAAFHRAAHVHPRDIGEAHALHAQRAHRTPLERAFELAQLPGIVGAFGFGRVIDVDHLRRAEIGRGLGEHVGQVVLVLRIAVGELA